MPGEGRDLSSRPTQDAVRDREIGQPNSLSDWSLAERRTGRNATLDCTIKQRMGEQFAGLVNGAACISPLSRCS